MTSLALLAFCALFSVAAAQKNLVIVGGSLTDDNAEIWNKVIELAGGEGVARVGIITAASSTPIDSAVYYQDMFASYGAAETYWIPIHEENTDANSDPEVVARIQQMTGFFFGGGDQLRIITCFYLSNGDESPALTALKATYEAGAVVGGTSAGAACMGTPVMVTGGMSYEAIRNGAYEIGTDEGFDDLTYYAAGGLGLLDGIIVDTHFGERGREGRLIRLLSDTKNLMKGAQFGVGIDEDSALVITDVGTSSAKGEVIGVRGVFFVDISQSKALEDGWTIVDVITHYLTGGDSIDLSSQEVTFASYKSDMVGQEESDYAYTSNDIFNGNRDKPLQLPEFIYTATELYNSRYSALTWGDSFELIPRYRVWLIQDSASVAYGGTNPAREIFQIGYHHMRISIEQTPSSAGLENMRV